MSTRRTESASRYEAEFGFCRGLRRGDQFWIAGTAPIGADGTNVGVGDPAAQARRCLEIISEAVDALGAALSDVTRTRMFLTRIDDWSTIGGVHGEFFGANPPVSTMVQIAALIDPEWLVEIEAEGTIDD